MKYQGSADTSYIGDCPDACIALHRCCVNGIITPQQLVAIKDMRTALTNEVSGLRTAVHSTQAMVETLRKELQSVSDEQELLVQGACPAPRWIFRCRCSILLTEACCIADFCCMGDHSS